MYLQHITVFYVYVKNTIHLISFWVLNDIFHTNFRYVLNKDMHRFHFR